LAATTAAAIEPNAEMECSVVGEFGGKTEVAAAPGLKVLGGPRTFPLTMPENVRFIGLMCDRTDFLPDPTDIRVVRHFDAPFYISTKDRVVRLDAAGPGFSLTLLDGPQWTVKEAARIKAFLDSLDVPSP